MTSSPAQRRASISDAQYQNSAALEPGDVGEPRMAIPCAARHHHRPGLDAFAAVQIEGERPVRARAIERPDADRDHHVSAEFLRLNEGAGGQGLAGDSGRKPEIVLDPGARSGLSAESAGVENRDRQALGGPIDGRRQAGGPGADHGDVIDEVRSRRGGHTDLAGERPLRGVAEHRAVGANDQR